MPEITFTVPGKIGVFVLNEMQCRCGGRSFKTLGYQDDLRGHRIPLINCLRCGTTLNCSEDFYQKLLDKEGA